MNFNRAMIDLVREIRKQAGADLKPLIRLANPELFSDLVSAFHQSDNVNLKALIQALFDIAEGGWPERIAIQADNASRSGENKVYRGQTSSVGNVNLMPPVALPSSKVTAQKMYRGRPVG